LLKKRKTAGYSLIEILVGIALMGSSLVAVAGVYPFATAHIQAMGNRIFVIQQAQSKMETIKSMSYKILLEDYAIPDAMMEQNPLEDTGKNKFEGYKFSASFQEKDKNLIHIKVQITWNEENAYGKYTKDKTYVLDGYKSQIDM
jgi:type II secretory pathway pseudopilin PulG